MDIASAFKAVCEMRAGTVDLSRATPWVHLGILLAMIGVLGYTGYMLLSQF